MYPRSTFILAGMDTTSNALSRILHLLAQNPDVQEKLRAEIIESRGGPGGDSDAPYDEVMKLPYLEAVCRETLRVHAPVVLSGRMCVSHSLVVLPYFMVIVARQRTWCFRSPRLSAGEMGRRSASLLYPKIRS